MVLYDYPEHLGGIIVSRNHGKTPIEDRSHIFLNDQCGILGVSVSRVVLLGGSSQRASIPPRLLQMQVAEGYIG